MKRASAIVTNRGGRTCHAAIIARELGIPAVVGTGSATRELADGRRGHGVLRRGRHRLRLRRPAATSSVIETELDAMPEIAGQDHDERRHPGPGVRVLPAAATPASGLARLEFIINRQIGIHPKALLDLDQLGRRRCKRADQRRGRRVRQPARLLRHPGRRGRLDARRRVRPGAGDRADVATSSPTSTPTWSAASCTSRTRRTR